MLYLGGSDIGDKEDSELDSDSDDESSSDDDSSDEEDGLDDSVCPPGCDQSIFDTTISMRERRLDLEESLTGIHCTLYTSTYMHYTCTCTLLLLLCVYVNILYCSVCVFRGKEVT